MRKKKTTVELTKGFRKYLDDVTKKYRARRKSLANTYLKVEYSPVGLYSTDYNRENNEIEYFPLKQRFTEAYGNSIYQKLKVLTGKNIHSFWTLTSRVDGSMLGFQDQHMLIKKGWRDFRSLMSKVGLKGVDYLRCYELTDNYGLHIHIAFYQSMRPDQMEKLALYWNKHRGWVKTYVYNNHRRSWPKSLMKDAFEPYRKNELDYGAVHADRREMWFVAGKIGYRPAMNVRIDGKVSKYIWKYMVKLASDSKQAVLWDNRIRTYAVSKNLNKSIIRYREAWKEENKIERGFPVNIEVWKQNWVEEIEWALEFYQKLRDKSNWAETWATPIYSIELVLSLHEFGQNKIHLEVSFNTDVVTFHTNDWYSDHGLLRGSSRDNRYSGNSGFSTR